MGHCLFSNSQFVVLIYTAVLANLGFSWYDGLQHDGGPEHKLYTDLFADYNSESRPVKNASHTVKVTFDLALNQLLDLDEKNQVLTTSVWIYEEWNDEMLTWSPDMYDQQKAIMIPADNIWLPDIFIFNTAGANEGFVNVNGSKVAIQYDGSVRWMVPLMVASACAVDVTYFPYDRQTCSIMFGSWIYDMEQLDIVTESTIPDMEHYVMNSEYDLRNVSISRDVLESSCCPGDGRHPMVQLKIELRRKSLYYDYIVIAPTIMLCVLTLASFLLPCDRGEKMAIGLTVFLTLYVLQLRIADNVPDTNSTPILGVFMLIVMTFNCVSLIMATIVMNIKKRGDENPCPDVPAWLFGLCHNVFGRVVCTRYLWKDEIPVPPHEKETLLAQKQGQNGVLKESNSNTISQKSSSSSKHENGRKIVAQKNKTKSGDGHGATGGENIKRSNEAEELSPLKRSPALSGKCYDPHKTPKPQSEGDAEMRLRKSKQVDGGRPQDTSGLLKQDRPQLAQNGKNLTDFQTQAGLEVTRSYLSKRRWFYVAEVVDKFLFLVYLVLLTSSIFTVLFLIPVYFRNDD